MHRVAQERIRRTGYTLVEVLTVCAIIGIVAALAMPSMVRTITKARRTKCANNLRQIGIAFSGFAHDHQDQYPHQTPAAEGGAREQNLSSPVLNGMYVLNPAAFQTVSAGFKSPQVVICPATRHWVSSFNQLNATNLCYALNLLAESGSATVPLASDSHLLGDWRLLMTSSVDRNRNLTIFNASRHEGRGNVVFGDGHVELQKSVAATPSVLLAAERLVGSAKRAAAREPPAATPDHQAGSRSLTVTLDRSLASAGSPVNSGPGLPLSESEKSAMPPDSPVRHGKETNVSPAAVNPSPAPPSRVESQWRRWFFGLWLLLAILGAALAAWQLLREKRRRLELIQRQAAAAADRRRENERRAAQSQSVRHG